MATRPSLSLPPPSVLPSGVLGGPADPGGQAGAEVRRGAAGAYRCERPGHLARHYAGGRAANPFYSQASVAAMIDAAINNTAAPGPLPEVKKQ